MDFNRLTEKVQQAVQGAQSKAVRLNNQQVDVEHLLAALIEQEKGLRRLCFWGRSGAQPDSSSCGAGTRAHAQGQPPPERRIRTPLRAV